MNVAKKSTAAMAKVGQSWAPKLNKASPNREDGGDSGLASTDSTDTESFQDALMNLAVLRGGSDGSEVPNCSGDAPKDTKVTSTNGDSHNDSHEDCMKEIDALLTKPSNDVKMVTENGVDPMAVEIPEEKVVEGNNSDEEESILVINEEDAKESSLDEKSTEDTTSKSSSEDKKNVENTVSKQGNGEIKTQLKVQRNTPSPIPKVPDLSLQFQKLVQSSKLPDFLKLQQKSNHNVTPVTTNVSNNVVKPSIVVKQDCSVLGKKDKGNLFDNFGISKCNTTSTDRLPTPAGSEPEVSPSEVKSCEAIPEKGKSIIFIFIYIH